jgi:hypothetical protein
MNVTQLAKHFNVENRAILKYREVDEGAIINALVDYGIGGIKEHYIPIAEFARPEPEPEPEPDLLPVPAVIDLNYRDLQELAKDAGIPANQSTDDLRFALSLEEEE